MIPSQTSKALNIKEMGNTVLKKIDSQGSRYAFGTFSHELVSYFCEKIHSETMRYKATGSYDKWT